MARSGPKKKGVKPKRSVRQEAYDEWVDMPEFIQEKKEPFSTIIIRCATEEDLNDLADKLGQKLTPRTKSIWHPKLVRGKHSQKRYVNEK